MIIVINKNSKICIKPVNSYSGTDCYKLWKRCNKAIDTSHSTMHFFLNAVRFKKWFIKLFIFNLFLFKSSSGHQKSKKMCNEDVSEDPFMLNEDV